MKANIIFFFLLFYSLKMFSQCDSVRVEMRHVYGDGTNEVIDKTVLHYSSTGKVLSSTKYGKNLTTNLWSLYHQTLYTYDVNDSLINSLTQTWNGTTWINVQQLLYEYNSFGSVTVYMQQQWVNNAWQTNQADSIVYDIQNRIVSNSSYDPDPVSRTLYTYTNSDSTIIRQVGDSTFTWTNETRTDLFYNVIPDKILEINFSWNVNVWDTLNRSTYSYNGSLLDSLIVERLDTVWKFMDLYTYQYDVQNRLIQKYNQSWTGTFWANDSSQMYDYGFLNHIIHTYYLTWNGTAWIYNQKLVNEVDSNGYPSYHDQLFASYDMSGNLTWVTLFGDVYYYYSVDGVFLGYAGENQPGGPYAGNYIYSNNILYEFHSYYETMGGLLTFEDRYYFYSEIYGDSIACTGQTVVLSLDSCPGNSYLWSTGETTSSISVTAPGTYSATIMHASGFSSSTSQINVTFVPGIPYLPSGIDSAFNVCGNSSVTLSVSQQFGASYQWYKNDTALANQNNASLSFNSTTLAEGEYYLIACNACGCDTSARTTINILPFPGIPVITPSGPLSFCIGDTLTLTSSLAFQYLWKPGNETSQSIQVVSSGNYYVYAFNDSGCFTRSAIRNVIARPYPPPLFVQIVGGSLSCNYNGTSQWFLNGDTILGATSSSFLPIIAGYYSMASYIYPQCITFSDSIYFDPSNLYLNVLSTKIICENGGGTIGANNPVIGGVPPYQYQWSPTTNLVNQGNGSAFLSNMTNDIVYYLTVTDSLGNSATDSVQVFVDHPVIPQLVVDSQYSLCANENNYVSILNYPLNSYTVLNWIVNGDSIGSTTKKYLASASGVFQIKILDQQGCTATSSPYAVNLLTVPVFPLIHATLDSSACVSGNATLWIDSHPFESYEWYRVSGSILLSTDTLLQTAAPENYQIIVTDSNGCSASSNFVFNLSSLTINLTIMSDGNTLCGSDTSILTANYLSGWNYEWTNNIDTLVITGNPISVTRAASYYCLATSPTGCTATGSYSIYQALNTPIATLQLTNGVFYASSSNHPATYEWYKDGVLIPGALTNSFTPVDTGYYFVRVKRFPGNGWQCFGYSNTVYFGNCTLSIIPVDSIACLNQCTGVLNGIGNGIGTITYMWADSTTSPTLSNFCGGPMSLTITDSLGCVSKDSIFIDIDSLAVQLLSTNATCLGCSDGRIVVNSIAGNPPFIISWLPANGFLNGSSIDSLEAGIYQVCVSDSFCTVCVTDTILDNTVFIDPLRVEDINYFPNPVINWLTIKGWPMNASKTLDVKIYNSVGVVVKSFYTSNNRFNVGELASGIYKVIIFANDNYYGFNFIKQ